MTIKPWLIAGLILSATTLTAACGTGAGGDSTAPTTDINGSVPEHNPIPTPEAPKPPPVADEEKPDLQPDTAPAATDTFYFSYDETGSTASRDLTFRALEQDLAPSPLWGRPYEFLNAESFDHFDLTIASPFNVSMGLYKSAYGEIPSTSDYSGSLYALGINVSGPLLTQAERPNVVLTLLVDVSGSMKSPYSSYIPDTEVSTLLDVAKTGLDGLLDNLKEGDTLNLVTFSNAANTVVEQWAYDPEDNSFAQAIANMVSAGNTDLNAGIQLAYQVANASYDAEKSNRVIILTDARANTGEVDPSIIAESTVINDLEGIHFSGIGIGESFNDRFLNELTDLGKGTYSAMITPSDAERIFSKNFMRFISPALTDVKFQISHPSSLSQVYSAAEDSSSDASEVSSVNFSYNAEQFFFEVFHGSSFQDTEQLLTLTIHYTDAEGKKQQVAVEKTLEELMAVGEEEIKSAAAVVTLAQIIAGELSCAEVTGSDLYQQDIRTYAFEKYKQGIGSICQ